MLAPAESATPLLEVGPRYPVTVRVTWATGEAIEAALAEDEARRVAQVLRFIVARRKGRGVEPLAIV